MRILAPLVAIGMVIGMVPAGVHAAVSGDQYADAVYGSGVATYAPENAVGAPDMAYADFQDELASVTLDMGENEIGTGPLTLSVLLLEYGASYQVDFLDADLSVIGTANDSFELYATEEIVAYDGPAYRYVKITCLTDKYWRLDAVTSAAYEEVADEVVSDGDETTVDEPDEQADATDGSQGLLVKLVDDQDATTTADAAIYVIGADGKRHAFPSETVYRSWFPDFEDVAFIDPSNLAAYELGGNVTVRPGTWLIKVQSDPKTYAVEPGGVLRWIPSEDIARALYGNNWADQIIDVPATLWGNYTVGDPIYGETHPTGTIAVLTSGEVTYLDEGTYYSLPGDVYDYMRFSTDFSVTLSEEAQESYAHAGDLGRNPDIAFPY